MKGEIHGDLDDFAASSDFKSPSPPQGGGWGATPLTQNVPKACRKIGVTGGNPLLERVSW